MSNSINTYKIVSRETNTIHKTSHQDRSLALVRNTRKRVCFGVYWVNLSEMQRECSPQTKFYIINN